jgi:hypothetical protein
MKKNEIPLIEQGKEESVWAVGIALGLFVTILLIHLF